MKKGIVKIAVFALLATYFLCPQSIQNPVEGANASNFNHRAFWHPWGDHHHRGIDIFAKKGTPIHPAVSGIVLMTMSDDKGHDGGNCILVLGTQGRFYYYAHLQEIKTHTGAFVTKDDMIGTVGDTGNAKGTPSHCHFSIATIIPQKKHMPNGIGELSLEHDSWQKMFFINPVDKLATKEDLLSHRL